MENENLTKVGQGFNWAKPLHDKPVRFFLPARNRLAMRMLSFSVSFFLVTMVANLYQITQSKRSKRDLHNISQPTNFCKTNSHPFQYFLQNSLFLF